MSSKKILGVELFRFATAIGIMVYHYFFIGVLQGFYSEKVFIPLGFFGEFGVDLFFVISGFVILYSTSKVSGAAEFLKKRAKRIYPPFIVCSVLTLLMGIVMPDTRVTDLLFRWINSLTFYSDLWNVGPLSSIYWTLMVEVKFYVLTAIVIQLGLWRKYGVKLLFAWEVIALLLYDSVNPGLAIVSKLLVLKYAGHFSLGIILYQIIIAKSHDKWDFPAIIGGYGL